MDENHHQRQEAVTCTNSRRSSNMLVLTFGFHQLLHGDLAEENQDCMVQPNAKNCELGSKKDSEKLNRLVSTHHVGGLDRDRAAESYFIII